MGAGEGEKPTQRGEDASGGARGEPARSQVAQVPAEVGARGAICFELRGLEPQAERGQVRAISGHARRRKASLDGEMIEVGRKVPVEKVGRGGGGRGAGRERGRSILVTRHWSPFNSEAWLGPGSDHRRSKALDDTENLFVGQNPVALFSALKNRVDELRPRLQAVVLEPALNVGKAAHGSHFDDL